MTTLPRQIGVRPQEAQNSSGAKEIAFLCFAILSCASCVRSRPWFCRWHSDVADAAMRGDTAALRTFIASTPM